VQYGGLAVYSTIAYISSAIINTKFIKYGFNKIMFPGAILSCLAAFAMIILYMIGYFNVLVIVLPFTIFLFAINLIQMNTLPLAITMYDKNKSSPAGLIIFVQTIFASILGIIASYLPAKNQFYLGVLMSISAIALLILLSIIFKKGTKI
ncbi:hypothetical protein KAJ27_19040, partial [bacterium]|nr:hypothetical protein [bacterium]